MWNRLPHRTCLVMIRMPLISILGAPDSSGPVSKQDDAMQLIAIKSMTYIMIKILKLTSGILNQL